MTGEKTEFQEDVEEMKEAVDTALNELSRVKAYTLTTGELREFKAAQYALRNLSEEHVGDNDVPSVYETRIEVRGDEQELKES